jgi:NAD(P)-dependent dehydrogenase (short-subunit alcohol dehydrogenase family)
MTKWPNGEMAKRRNGQMPSSSVRALAMGRLSGKTALITGAASGIGSACALRFAQEGARLFGFDANGQGDERWLEAAQLSGGAPLIVGDVRREAEVEAAVAQAQQHLGRLDLLINSAGVAGGGPVHILATEEWDRVIDINLKGTFLFCKHTLAVMLAQKSGSIVNLASIEGLEAFEGGSAYNASKAAVVLLTKNMAMDYGRQGIRVNAICPGFIQTPLMSGVLDIGGFEEVRARVVDLHQMGRFGRPEEIASAALFLASDDASFVTGHSLVVDGGYTAGHRVGLGKMMGLE